MSHHLESAVCVAVTSGSSTPLHRVNARMVHQSSAWESHFLFFFLSLSRPDFMTNPDVKSRAEPATRVATSLRLAVEVNTLSCKQQLHDQNCLFSLGCAKDSGVTNASCRHHTISAVRGSLALCLD